MANQIRQIVLRKDTKGNYSSNNTVLSDGEPAIITITTDEFGYSPDANDTRVNRYLVIGDGATYAHQLPPIGPSFGIGPRKNGVDLTGKGRYAGITNLTSVGNSPTFATLWEAVMELWYPYSPPGASLSLNVSNPVEVGTTQNIIATLTATAGRDPITQSKILNVNTAADITVASVTPFSPVITPVQSITYNANGVTLSNDYYRHSFRGEVTDSVETTTNTKNVDFVHPHYVFTITQADRATFLAKSETDRGTDIVANGSKEVRYKGDKIYTVNSAATPFYWGLAFPITGSFKNAITGLGLAYNGYSKGGFTSAFDQYNVSSDRAIINSVEYGFIIGKSTVTANTSYKIFF